MTYQHEWKSPLGTLRLFMDESCLTGLYFPDHSPAPRVTSGVRDAQPFHHVVTQLSEYFAGERTVFNVPMTFQGTAFQRDVWSCLQQIPYGDRTSYLAIARQLGRAKAVRAVGGAVARNPVSIIVPCHRVVGLRGALTGFAGGVERKKTLLDLERTTANAIPPLRQPPEESSEAA